ncbi:MAG: hypothetical protein JSS81_12330 [Acidobacteria bacterium]|nr:hypothetical protein [Acidobacteriota bacterium]
MVNLSDAQVGSSENAGCSFQQFNKDDLTFMSVSANSILYTRELSKRSFEIWETIDPDTKIKRGVRQLGEIVAADIECPEGESLKFRVEGPFGFTIDLPVEPDVSYLIEFDNACIKPACEDQTDFRHYYEFMNSDRKLELVALPLPDPDEDKGTGVGACLCTGCRHLIGIDESLAELVN